MKGVIELLKKEILWKHNTLNNLLVSLADSRNDEKKCKEWIADTKQELSSLDKILEVATYMSGGVKPKEKK